jgi:hypothetical protein
VLELVVAYLVVADEGIGRQVPFTFLDRVKEDFKKRYQEGKTDLAVAYSLDQEFGCDSKKSNVAVAFEVQMWKIKQQVQQFIFGLFWVMHILSLVCVYDFLNIYFGDPGGQLQTQVERANGILHSTCRGDEQGCKDQISSCRGQGYHDGEY